MSDRGCICGVKLPPWPGHLPMRDLVRCRKCADERIAELERELAEVRRSYGTAHVKLLKEARREALLECIRNIEETRPVFDDIIDAHVIAWLKLMQKQGGEGDDRKSE